jgi:DNA (cytosine-5)-methyltransferase 1
MENVPEVRTHTNDQGNRIFDSILSRCGEIGYKFKWNLLNAAHYGVPQSRTRLILVGSIDEDCKIRFPKPDFKIQEDVDVKSASRLFDPDCEREALPVESVFKDLPVLEDNESDSSYLFEPSKIKNKKQREYVEYLRQGDPELSDHVTSKNGGLMKKRMSFAGEQKEDIPDYISPSSGYSSTYSRLYKGIPSTTLTTNFTTPSSTRCIHPYEPRAISVREGARIQSFPDRFDFCGPKTSVTNQIGNAVPPKLGEAIGETVTYCLNQLDAE